MLEPMETHVAFVHIPLLQQLNAHSTLLIPNGSSNHQAFGASNQAGHLRQRILRPKDVALGYPSCSP